MKVAMSGASGFVANALKQKFPNYVVIERGDDVEAIKHKLVGRAPFLISRVRLLLLNGMKRIKKCCTQAVLIRLKNWSKRSIKVRWNISSRPRRLAFTHHCSV